MLNRLRSLRPLVAVVLGTLTLGAAAACTDPLKDRQIAELGEEQDGFPESPIHRPGQPCVLCHSDYFGAEPKMVLGGTVFVEPEEPGGPLLGAPGYEIRLTDSEGRITERGLITTNECGNFWITEEQFNPAYPLRVEILGPSLSDTERIVQISAMSTRIGRDGSCGACHAEPVSPLSPGAVLIPRALFNPDVELPAPGDCPEPRYRPTVPESLTQ